MNKKATKTETNTNTTKETNPGTKETAKDLQPITKSITTINHRSKEAEEIRYNKFKLIITDIQSKGKGLNAAAKKHGLNPNTFFNMLEKDPQLIKQYTRALELKADVIAERIIRNSHNRANDFYTDADGNQKPNPVSVQRDRLILDADKWLLSKIAPKKYGDKLTLDGEVKTGQPLTIEQINVIVNELKE